MSTDGDPRGLALNGMRGLRYDADRVSGLAEVTCPPYDVLDEDGVLALEAMDPHNVVRLILPRDEESGPEGRYEHAARMLRRWVAEGVLRTDPAPGLYVYEQASGDRVLQRGLIGAVGLRDPDERVVLPHEDVMPGPVADRLELMRAARANVEPILLMYDGEEGATSAVVLAVSQGTPVVEATGGDGITHRLWEVVDPAVLETVRDDLASRQALIADGHHRYAAYRLLQSELRGTDGDGPWDFGLALLVDLRAHPPQVGAIHRTVDGLSVEDAVAAADGTFACDPVALGDVADALKGLRTGQLLLVDAASAAILHVPDDMEPVVARWAVPAEWAGLDTAVLHQVLIDGLWKADESAVQYHHDAAHALQRVGRQGGTAVLLAPVTVEDVLALAARGVRMPRKSTSFGPKPRTGLVLRAFDTA